MVASLPFFMACYLVPIQLLINCGESDTIVKKEVQFWPLLFGFSLGAFVLGGPLWCLVEPFCPETGDTRDVPLDGVGDKERRDPAPTGGVGPK